MIITEEIRKCFANRDVDIVYPLENIVSRYPAWVVHFQNSFGVAVPYRGNDVYEEFANAVLYSHELRFNGENRRCLLLTSSREVEVFRNEFALFCRDFVFPGDDGKLRRELTSDPVSWWKRWKILIGNAIAEKRPYAVLGELIIYGHLLRNGAAVDWTGPNSTSHDIVAPDVEYEIKSTLSRYDRIVHISGQFQLQNAAERLFLYFCRFEKNMNGICIDDMVKKLVDDYGISLNELNKKLGRLGYGVGSSARKEKYQIHEVLRYLVDDQFPRITPEMFKAGAIPAGIRQLSYDVDLSVIEGKNIDVEIEYI